VFFFFSKIFTLFQSKIHLKVFQNNKIYQLSFNLF